MRLLKRTQPEKGFIVFNHYNGYNYVVENDENQECLKCKCFCEKGLFLDSTENSFGNFEYIGKIGHNFEIKNGKLVKKKLPDISVDDVLFQEHTLIHSLVKKIKEGVILVDTFYAGSFIDTTEINIEFMKKYNQTKGNLAYNYKIEGGV